MNRSGSRPFIEVSVRRAVPEDLREMAGVHVDGWKTTYRGMVPDALLNRLSIDEDIANGFGRGLVERLPGAEQFVALDPSEGIVGYALAGPNRDPNPDFAGELEAIYVRKSHQGQGVGTLLVREVARCFLGTGMKGMIVWVLPQNPYRRFYERLGGTLVGQRVSPPHRLGVGPMLEVGYGWTDVRLLANL